MAWVVEVVRCWLVAGSPGFVESSGKTSHTVSHSFSISAAIYFWSAILWRNPQYGSSTGLLHRPPKTASPKRVLPIITPYSPEGRHFSQSVRNRWHIIENDSELQNVWSNHPITAYHKTKSLKDMLVHSRQTKPISSRPVPTKFR